MGRCPLVDCSHTKPDSRRGNETFPPLLPTGPLSDHVDAILDPLKAATGAGPDIPKWNSTC